MNNVIAHNLKRKKTILSEKRPNYKLLTLDWWRLLCWVVGDGNIRHDSQYKKIIRWGLVKQRKVKRLQKMLESCDIAYTIHHYDQKMKNGKRQEVTYISVFGRPARDICYLLKSDMKNKQKRLPNEILKESRQVKGVILAELVFIDGYMNHSSCQSAILATAKLEELSLYAALVRSLNWQYSFCTAKSCYKVRLYFPEKIHYYWGDNLYYGKSEAHYRREIEHSI